MSDDAQLVELVNRHATPAPRFARDEPGRYVGFFQSGRGGQLLLVHRWGEELAFLYVGRDGWQPVPVGCGAHDMPEILDPDTTLRVGERAWLIACWMEVTERIASYRRG